MKVGVKVGPDEFESVFEKSHAKYCEVWFRLDWEKRYSSLFKYLHKNNVKFGLHFWSVLDGGYEPNLVYDQDKIADESEDHMRKTIDIAVSCGASYVNIHPGSFRLKLLDLENSRMVTMLDKKINKEYGIQSLFTRAKRLHKYSENRNILFLVETLPKNELEHWSDETGRVNVRESDNVSPDILVKLGARGIYINNDIGHTLSSIVTDDRKKIWNYLENYTKKLFPFTKMLHINTVISPFNGTDSHNGILDKDFNLNVLPDKKQLIRLLQMFKDREDIWLIPEPQKNAMVDNYHVLDALTSQLLS